MYILPEHNFAEIERDFYQSQLSDYSQVDQKDLEQAWLQDVTSSTETDVQSLWQIYLRSETGVTNEFLRDSWKQFLEGNGYTGHIYDQTVKYFEDNT